MFSTPLRVSYSDAGSVPNGNPAYYAGMDNFTVDGSSYDPYWKGVGVDTQWTSEGVNDQIEGKLIVVPPRHSKHWQVQYPLGSLLFSSSVPFDELRKNTARLGRRSVFRSIDRVEALTPEQLNYHLAKTWFDTAVNNRPTIDEIYKSWRLAGANITPPETKRGDGMHDYDPSRLGEERVIAYRPFADEKVVNYWGMWSSGNDHPYLFLVLKMVRITNNTILYQLGQNGDENARVNANTDSYYPQWVAVASDYARTPPKEALEYEYVDPKTSMKVKMKGRCVRVGRMIKNPEYQGSTNAPAIRELEVRDMLTSANRYRIDVMLDIREIL